eukprot:scaffold8536_cov36-Cyclotella_meneghiniana.AAC.9
MEYDSETQNWQQTHSGNSLPVYRCRAVKMLWLKSEMPIRAKSLVIAETGRLRFHFRKWSTISGTG